MRPLSLAVSFTNEIEDDDAGDNIIRRGVTGLAEGVADGLVLNTSDELFVLL